MAATYYRIQAADRDPAELLDPASQSVVWTGVGTVTTACGDCNGTGRGEAYEDSVSYDAPACDACHGTGQVDDSVRAGVSCCRTLRDLYAYFRGRDADLDSQVVVELEAAEADSEDWDASHGAVLVHPTAILDTWPLDPAEVQ